jgi:hypothetical protein
VLATAPGCCPAAAAACLVLNCLAHKRRHKATPAAHGHAAAAPAAAPAAGCAAAGRTAAARAREASSRSALRVRVCVW